MSRVPFYDNIEPDSAAEDVAIRVERVYCMRVLHFSHAQLAQLSMIYETLPGWCRDEDLPRWFGVDETRPPYLWASAEPSGILVSGCVDRKLWEIWDRLFSEACISAGLPTFAC